MTITPKTVPTRVGQDVPASGSSGWEVPVAVLVAVARDVAVGVAVATAQVQSDSVTHWVLRQFPVVAPDAL